MKPPWRDCGSVNHWGATRQLMGNSIFGNHGKTLFRPKYSGVFDLKEKSKDWLAFSFKDSSKNLQDQIHYSYKTNCSWPQHRKETCSEAFNREFSSHFKACKIPERYLGNIILTESTFIRYTKFFPTETLLCCFDNSARIIVFYSFILYVCMCTFMYISKKLEIPLKLRMYF